MLAVRSPFGWRFPSDRSHLRAPWPPEVWVRCRLPFLGQVLEMLSKKRLSDSSFPVPSPLAVHRESFWEAAVT